MKRSLLAAAALLALGSASASVYAETPGFPQPSFKDYTDLAPAPITGAQTVDQRLPKGTFNSGGPKGPATVVLQGNDRATAQYANASIRSTRTDAQSGEEIAPNLNDTFHYPAY